MRADTSTKKSGISEGGSGGKLSNESHTDMLLRSLLPAELS